MADDESAPYDFRPSGVVYVTVGEKQHTLRRPLLGEFRTFREAHHEADLAISRAGSELRQRLVTVNEELMAYTARAMTPTARAQRLHVLDQTEDLDPAREAERERLGAAGKPLTADDLEARAKAEATLRDVMSGLDDAGLEAWATWTAEVLGKLAGLDVTPDKLDPALCSSEFTVGLIDHWRNVTPPRGR